MFCSFGKEIPITTANLVQLFLQLAVKICASRCVVKVIIKGYKSTLILEIVLHIFGSYQYHVHCNYICSDLMAVQLRLSTCQPGYIHGCSIISFCDCS
jgi:hypothetical protein